MPPATSVAPCATALSTCSCQPLGRGLTDDSGPSTVSSANGSPTFDAGHRGRELLEERLVQVVDDDEPLGRVARLAGVVEARVDGGLHRAVEVVGRQQDERVRPAELERDLLEVAPGDLGDRCAGALGAR